MPRCFADLTLSAFAALRAVRSRRDERAQHDRLWDPSNDLRRHVRFRRPHGDNASAGHAVSAAAGDCSTVPLAAARYVADDSEKLWEWPIFPLDFDGRRLMARTKAQV